MSTTTTDNHAPEAPAAETTPAPELGADAIDPRLAAALVQFQGQVKTIPKNRTAKIPTKTGGSYSYKYADLADTWEVIREPLKDNGLAVLQMLSGGQTGWMGITTTVVHTSGATHGATVDINIAGRSPQEVGSQITYYKRYTLSAALGLDTDEDNDAAGVAAAGTPEPEEVEETPEQAEARAQANEARGELVMKLEPFGFTRDKLQQRFWNDYKKNLLSINDPALIRQFGENLLEEAKAAAAKGEPTGQRTAAEPEGPISPRTMKHLNTLLGKQKLAQHDAAVQWCSEALGYEVTSRNNLTDSEGLKLIEKLKLMEKQQDQQDREEPHNAGNRAAQGPADN
jgi:hypothetical protein